MQARSNCEFLGLVCAAFVCVANNSEALSPPNLKMKSSSLPGGCAGSIIVIFDVGLYCDLLWALLWFSCGLIYLVIHLC